MEKGGYEMAGMGLEKKKKSGGALYCEKTYNVYVGFWLYDILLLHLHSFRKS